MSLEETLLQLAEEEYRAFASRLLPGVSNLLGVRLPALRKLAAQIARGEFRGFLREGAGQSMEAKLLRGMVIGAAEMPTPERMEWVREYVPEVDNWSVCDSFAASLTCARRQPGEWLSFLAPYFVSAREFDVRFGCAMLVNAYANPEWIGEALACLSKVSHEGYYARMGAAWAASACMVRCPDKTEPFLRAWRADAFTRRKALQKILESRAASAEVKARVRAMRDG